MAYLRLQLEQEIRVEIIIFGEGQVVAREAPDRVEIGPQGEHLDMGDAVVPAEQAPGAAVAAGRAIIGQSHVGHQLQIFRQLGAGDPPVPSPRDHRQRQPA